MTRDANALLHRALDVLVLRTLAAGRGTAGALACFHVNALIFRPTNGWTPADSEASREHVLTMCGDLYKDAIGDLVNLK